MRNGKDKGQRSEEECLVYFISKIRKFGNKYDKGVFPYKKERKDG